VIGGDRIFAASLSLVEKISVEGYYNLYESDFNDFGIDQYCVIYVDSYKVDGDRIIFNEELVLSKVVKFKLNKNKVYNFGYWG